MIVKKFNIEKDYEMVSQFLEECYRENKNMVCWLPERFDDLLYRVDTLYKEERGLEASKDYIYLFLENNEIVGIIVPDGDSMNTCIKNGYEEIFSMMVELGEKELLPLFQKEEDGSIDFLVISHDSLTYQQEELLKRGYVRDKAKDYDNVQHPQEKEYKLQLPEGYSQVYGDSFDDQVKIKVCHYGFHSQDDDGILTGKVREGTLSYQTRKKSKFYSDSFESLIITTDNDICSYCFCYVNKKLSTAFIEPVCTREKYRHLGLCRQMLYGVMIKLKDMGIENAYINSYDWRREVYIHSGFETEDSISFWHKKIKK